MSLPSRLVHGRVLQVPFLRWFVQCFRYSLWGVLDCWVQDNVELSFETVSALKEVLILAKKLLLCIYIAEGVLCSSGKAVIGGVKSRVPAGREAQNCQSILCLQREMSKVWSDCHVISRAHKYDYQRQWWLCLKGSCRLGMQLFLHGHKSDISFSSLADHA